MIFSLIQSECYRPMFAAGVLWQIAEGTTTVTTSQLHGNIGLVQQSTDRPWSSWQYWPCPAVHWPTLVIIAILALSSSPLTDLGAELLLLWTVIGRWRRSVRWRWKAQHARCVVIGQPRRDVIAPYTNVHSSILAVRIHCHNFYNSCHVNELVCASFIIQVLVINRQIPHHSNFPKFFYRSDALPDAHPSVSKALKINNKTNKCISEGHFTMTYAQAAVTSH